ncbi:MAG: hypothetical protein ACXVXY_07180 [Mycobacteriaceae bacterium]
MTGGELSAEERKAWYARAAKSGDDFTCNLLNALDAAEARVAAVEAERDEDALATERENGNLRAEVLRMTASRDSRKEGERQLARRLDDSRAENRRLSALVKAGLALHVPDPTGDWCDHCWTGPDSHGNGPSPEWPCATVRALGGAS